LDITIRDLKQLENVEYLDYSGMRTKRDAKCGTRETKSRTAITKAAFNKKTFHKQTGLKV
jgi:hypothetical protein